ncbi:unnamed protein product [Dracunculus medinensis]|uniref:RING-type domain-containing protein n=1 Tax=Dracunculus medinensis TaxID=318479 RepID=A0A0N4U2A1_DRAME|nr:unnamed protein product [Dracunculus medinensis]
MSDWLHCNNCFHLPGQKNENLPFFFTSCGHLICRKCLSTTASVGVCRICQKRASIIEINRNLRADLQMYFRNPKDLLEQYVKNLNVVLEFQGGHRNRLAKALQEQVGNFLLIQIGVL